MSRQVKRLDKRSVEAFLAKKIDPKPLAVLIALANKNGAVVTREELFRDVWEDAIVIEEALTRCISDLRKIFKETPDNPKVIETIRGVGYRMIPQVSWIERPILGSKTIKVADLARSKLDRALLYIGLAIGGIVLAIFWIQKDESLTFNQPAYTIPSSVATGTERFASIAPNGKSIAYSVSEDGHSYTIQILDSVDAKPRELTHSFAERASSSFLGPIWSADNNRIGFMQKKGTECQIWIAEVDGQRFERIGDCEGNFHNDVVWSVDQKWFAFSAAPANRLPQKIFLLALNDSERFELTDGGGSHFGDHHPAFSPDGLKVAFIRTQSEARSEIFVINLETKETHQVTNDHRVINGLDWVDENQIIFSSNRSGRFQLWRIPDRVESYEGNSDAGVSEPIWVPTSTDNAFDPSVAAHTKNVLFAVVKTVTSIEEWKDGIERAVISNTSQNRSPHFSPDEKRLAYVSSITGETEIWIADATGSNQRQISDLKTFVDGPRWSPDGSRIAFFGGPEESLDLLVYGVGDESIQRISSELFDDVLPRWSADGGRLYYASDKSGEWQIWYLDSSNFQVPPVSTGMRGLAIVELPAMSGGGFYVANPDSSGIVHFSANFERIGNVGADLSELDWGAWDVVNEGLFYLQRDSVGTAVYHLPLRSPDGNSHRMVFSNNGSPWAIPMQVPALDVSRDGSTILFVRNMVAESELLLLGSIK